ncbi:MAG TPA: thermonuclease family protein [Terriglobia bacterium]|nr:thermonuclease family protein [Terriglobia bacterium]
MYEYTARLLRVVDGDTIYVEVDLGFTIKMEIELRLEGVNTPEMKTPEGPPAKQVTVDWLAQYDSLIIETEKDKKEKWGRYLAVVWPPDKSAPSLNALLIGRGWTYQE